MTSTRWLDPTQETAWRSLLTIVNRALPELDRTLRAHKLLAVHYHILVTLSEAPGRTMRLSDLADTANLSQSRLTHRLRALVEAGDVAIDPDPDDGRAKQAALTEAGLARLEAVAPDHVADVHRLLFDHLDPTQTEALADALSTVAQRLCLHPEYLNPRG